MTCPHCHTPLFFRPVDHIEQCARLAQMREEWRVSRERLEELLGHSVSAAAGGGQQRERGQR